MTSRGAVAVAFLALTAAPIAVLVWAAISLSGDAVTQDGQQRATAIAASNSVFLDQRFQTWEESLNSYAQLHVAPVIASPSAVRDQLQVLTQSQLGVDIAFVQVDGTDIAGWPESILEQPWKRYAVASNDTSVYREDWLQGLQSTNRPFLASVAPLDSSDNGGIAVAIGLNEDGSDFGNRVGYMVAISNMVDLQTFIDDYRSTNSASLTILDEGANPLIWPGSQSGQKPPVSAASRSLVSRALRGHQSVLTRTAPDGSPLFTAYAPITKLGWAVVVDSPASASVQEVSRLRTTVLTVGLVLSVILLGGLALGLRLMSRAQQSASLRTRITSLGHLNDAARSVHEQHGMAALETIAETSRSLTTADVAVLTVVDPDTLERLHSITNGGERKIGGELFPNLATAIDRVHGVRSEVRLDSIRDLASDADYGVPLPLPPVGPVLSVPLLAGQSLLGRLCVVRTEGSDQFEAEELALLEQLAEHAVTAIEKAKHEEDLSEKNAQLETASRLKSEFLANMSHELRTPLSAIIGFSELLLSGSDGDLSVDQLDDITQINNSGKTLLELINDILDLSKIEAGRMILELGTVDISSVVSPLIASMRPLAAARSLNLTAELPEDLTAVRADAMRVRQILTNLVSNALKFTPEGGVTIRCQEEGDMVEISVIDTGIGIPQEAQGRIFEEFMQADGSTTRKFGGTGLGLAITRRLIQLQGGEIGVESAVGQGSRFWFTLPIATAREDRGDAAVPTLVEVATDAVPAQPWIGQTRDLILVVDDEPQARQLITRRLNDAGFTTEEVGNPAEALRLAKEVHPAAITLDVMMPNIDGWKVLNYLKSDPMTNDIPVIMISIVDGKERAVELGASAYLTKPVETPSLLSTVRAVLPALDGADILCVDDEQSVRELVSRSLSQAHAKVRTVDSGLKALDEVKKRIPSAIIADLMMPEMSGFELIVRLRTRPDMQQVPIIVLSAMDLGEDEMAMLGTNIDRFIRKPSVEVTNLAATVRQAIEHRRKHSSPAVQTQKPEIAVAEGR